MLAAKYPPEIASRQPAVNFVTALAIADITMGGEWLEKRTSPFSPKPGYYRLTATADEQIAAIGGQTHESLGEMLLGSPVRPEPIHASHAYGKALEPTVAKLGFASMIYVNDWQFEFIKQAA